MMRQSLLACALVILAGCETRGRALAAIDDARTARAAALAPGTLAAAERALASADQVEPLRRRDAYAEARRLAVRARAESERNTRALAAEREKELARREREHALARDVLDDKRAALVPTDEVPGAERLARVPPRTLLRRLQEGDASLLLLDVRGDAAFAAGHVQGATSTSLLALEHASLPRAVDIVLYGTHGGSVDVVRAARVLEERGYTRVAVLAGGFERWRSEDLPQGGRAVGAHEEEAPVLRPDELQRWLTGAEASSVVVVDVRAPELYAAGHVPGAVRASLEELSRSAPLARARGAVVVYSADERSSRAAARALLESGRRLVHRLEGGTRAWAEHGYRLEQGTATSGLALGGAP